MDILVCDDDDMALEVVEESLKKLGYEVILVKKLGRHCGY